MLCITSLTTKTVRHTLLRLWKRPLPTTLSPSHVCISRRLRLQHPSLTRLRHGRPSLPSSLTIPANLILASTSGLRRGLRLDHHAAGWCFKVPLSWSTAIRFAHGTFCIARLLAGCIFSCPPCRYLIS